MKLKVNSIAYIAASMLILIAGRAAADCNNARTATTPDTDFVIYNNGTAAHKLTGLMWMRCSLGQSWNGSTCTGTATNYTWKDALAAPKQSQGFARNYNWRLPTKIELITLLERRCQSPSINSVVFPNTPESPFWSSTEFEEYPHHQVNSDMVWTVDLWFLGLMAIGSKSKGEYPVLLVRNADSFELLDSRPK